VEPQKKEKMIGTDKISKKKWLKTPNFGGSHKLQIQVKIG
jgi:hypothetical protein